MWRCLPVVVLQPLKWFFRPTIFFFVANFATKLVLTNKLLLVSLILGCIVLQGCINALYRGMPCTFKSMCPFMVMLWP